MSIRSLEHRILKKLPTYRRFGTETLPEGLVLRDDEEALGIYRSSQRDEVVVSSGGVFQRQGAAWRAFRFVEMENVVAPADKEHGDRIKISLVGGGEGFVLVEGARGRFRDVFEFARFLSRAMEMARRSTSEASP